MTPEIRAWAESRVEIVARTMRDPDRFYPWEALTKEEREPVLRKARVALGLTE